MPGWLTPEAQKKLGAGGAPSTPTFGGDIQEMLKLWSQFFQPFEGAFAAGAANRGQAVGQQFASSLGALGGGSTGVGQLGYGIGNTMAGSEIAKSKMQLATMISGLAQQSGMGAADLRLAMQRLSQERYMFDKSREKSIWDYIGGILGFGGNLLTLGLGGGGRG